MVQPGPAPPRTREIELQLNQAAALLDRRESDAALACLERALALDPRHAGALHLKGNLLFAGGRYEEAVASYHAVLDHQPEHIDSLLACGRLFTEVGRTDDALAHYGAALFADSRCEPAWAAFSALLATRDSVHELLGPLVFEALVRDNLDPQSAARPAADLLCRDPRLQPYLALQDSAADAAARMAGDLAAGRLQPVLAMPQLLAVLEETIVMTPRLQTFLGFARSTLLRALTETLPPVAAPAVERFACALALQCFANEYVWPESDQEREKIAALGAKTAQALQARAPVPPLWLALLGAYRPLHRLGFADGIGVPADANHPLAKMLERQLLEPRREAQLKQQIPTLGTIADPVSNAVREQYEENPYPRWRRRAPEVPQPVDAYLRGLFPGRIPGRVPDAPDILVAGCGTGSHPVLIAQRVPRASILAVDLSRASLAYAKRSSDALGLSGIDYLQADILALGALSRSFDVVESVGVLHHMRDPLAGWRVLAGLLRPGGYMHIGLYSRTARRSITAARAFIQARGYPATLGGIRQARQAILAGESGLSLNEIAGHDFHNTSSCRDLLFNVQEHLYTPGEIAASLRALNLEFLGFELRPAWLGKLYLQQFPADVTLTSLDNWERFEAAHPAAFFGMYQFWVRKP
jgi:SAM-dependent methyltransferase